MTGTVSPVAGEMKDWKNKTRVKLWDPLSHGKPRIVSGKYFGPMIGFMFLKRSFLWLHRRIA